MKRRERGGNIYKAITVVIRRSCKTAEWESMSLRKLLSIVKLANNGDRDYYCLMIETNIIRFHPPPRGGDCSQIPSFYDAISVPLTTENGEMGPRLREQSFVSCDPISDQLLVIVKYSRSCGR